MKKSFLGWTTCLLLSLLFLETAYAWQEWEKEMIDSGCHHYASKNPVNEEYIRCLKVEFKATEGQDQKVEKVEKSPSSILACAKGGGKRVCDVGLINDKGYVVLNIYLELIKTQNGQRGLLPSVTLNSHNLGDKCNCEVEEWAVESDTSVIYGWGLWKNKEAFPVIRLLAKADNMKIYATIPDSKKPKYRAFFSDKKTFSFKKKLERALNYIKANE